LCEDGEDATDAGNLKGGDRVGVVSEEDGFKSEDN